MNEQAKNNKKGKGERRTDPEQRKVKQNEQMQRETHASRHRLLAENSDTWARA